MSADHVAQAPLTTFGGLEVRTLQPWMTEQCAALERMAFPHTDPNDLLKEEDILAYSRTYPDGFFVFMDEMRVVGQGAGILLDFNFSQPQHTLAEISGEHQCGRHNPNGDWYYGIDIAVHPDYRRRGIGRQLYELRKRLVMRHDKRGIIAGGHIPGFARYKHCMSAWTYAKRVARGEIYDPTLSFQLANGFKIRGVLENYVRDDATDGWSVLICWRNPNHSTGAESSSAHRV